MFSSGDPDINGCYKGRALKIEVKVTGGTLSELQAEQMQKWTNAGAIVMLAVYDYKTKLFSVWNSARSWKPYAGIKTTAIVSDGFLLIDCKSFSWEYLLRRQL